MTYIYWHLFSYFTELYQLQCLVTSNQLNDSYISWTGNDWKESSHGLCQDTITELSWNDWKKHDKHLSG